MESKSILVGIVIGIIVGSLAGFIAAPQPDVSDLNLQIEQLQQQVNTLQDEKNNLETTLQTKNMEIEGFKTQIEQLQKQVDQVNSQLLELQASSISLSEYEAAINELESKINTLQQTFNYTPGTWNTINTWMGAADKTTGLFYVPSDQIRITWDLAVSQYSSFSILLYEEGSEYYTDAWMFLDSQPEGETHAYIEPGQYYLKFSVANCDYSVTLETIIP